MTKILLRNSDRFIGSVTVDMWIPRKDFNQLLADLHEARQLYWDQTDEIIALRLETKTLREEVDSLKKPIVRKRASRKAI